jgi:hypothetical protein
MMEKLLEAILDVQTLESIPDNQQAPPDPMGWIDDFFGGGWMTSGPFVDGTVIDDTSMYSSGQDWTYQF